MSTFDPIETMKLRKDSLEFMGCLIMFLFLLWKTAMFATTLS